MTPKHELRAAMRALRKRLTETEPEAAERAAGHADALPLAETVALYRAMGSELDTGALANVLHQAGRRLCLPVVLERDAAMIFRAWAPGEPLELDAAGCPAPLPLSEVVRPDLILTPLLAFDAHGGRLGQGAAITTGPSRCCPTRAGSASPMPGRRSIASIWSRTTSACMAF